MPILSVNNKMRINIYKKEYGFSLIETLIAVSILMIALAGPFALVQAGLFSSIHERNQITATYLAQEAIEYIKNLRDSNSYSQYGSTPVYWLSGPDGNSLLDTCSASVSGCYVDPFGGPNGNVYVQSVNGSDTPLNLINKSGVLYYSYGAGGTPSPYTRVVTITPVPVGDTTSDEATVSVKMTWKDNALSRSYTVSENIYNYEQP